MARSENLQDVPLQAIKAHPEMLVNLLSTDKDVSILLEKRGDTVWLGVAESDPPGERLMDLPLLAGHRPRGSLPSRADIYDEIFSESSAI